MNKTEEELKQIAKDIKEDKIFTDRHCKNPKDINKVFLPINVGITEFYKSKSRREFERKIKSGDIYMFFEYISNAIELTVDNLPVFTSFDTLSLEEVNKVFSYIDKLKEAESKALEG